MFFMAWPGESHEVFQLEKLAGFILVILGVLFFEEILAIEGCRIVYRDEEDEEDESNKLMAKKFDEDRTSSESHSEHGALLEETTSKDDAA